LRFFIEASVCRAGTMIFSDAFADEPVWCGCDDDAPGPEVPEPEHAVNATMTARLKNFFGSIMIASDLRNWRATNDPEAIERSDEP
jgi:hypothetical protein